MDKIEVDKIAHLTTTDIQAMGFPNNIGLCPICGFSVSATIETDSVLLAECNDCLFSCELKDFPTSKHEHLRRQLAEGDALLGDATVISLTPDSLQLILLPHDNLWHIYFEHLDHSEGGYPTALKAFRKMKESDDCNA